jgi:hypothetical protein
MGSSNEGAFAGYVGRHHIFLNSSIENPIVMWLPACFFQLIFVMRKQQKSIGF